MRRNLRELPDLVRLASGFGMEQVFVQDLCHPSSNRRCPPITRPCGISSQGGPFGPPPMARSWSASASPARRPRPGRSTCGFRASGRAGKDVPRPPAPVRLAVDGHLRELPGVCHALLHGIDARQDQLRERAPGAAFRHMERRRLRAFRSAFRPPTPRISARRARSTRGPSTTQCRHTRSSPRPSTSTGPPSGCSSGAWAPPSVSGGGPRWPPCGSHVRPSGPRFRLRGRSRDLHGPLRVEIGCDPYGDALEHGGPVHPFTSGSSRDRRGGAPARRRASPASSRTPCSSMYSTSTPCSRQSARAAHARGPPRAHRAHGRLRQVAPFPAARLCGLAQSAPRPSQSVAAQDRWAERPRPASASSSVSVRPYLRRAFVAAWDAMDLLEQVWIARRRLAGALPGGACPGPALALWPRGLPPRPWIPSARRGPSHHR